MVIDSSALVAILLGEPGAAEIAALNRDDAQHVKGVEVHRLLPQNAAVHGFGRFGLSLLVKGEPFVELGVEIRRQTF